MQSAEYVYATVDGVVYPALMWDKLLNFVITPDFCICKASSVVPRIFVDDASDFHMSVGMPVNVLDRSSRQHGVIVQLNPLRVETGGKCVDVSISDLEYRCDYTTLTDEGVEVRCTVDTLPIVANVDGIKIIQSGADYWIVPHNSPEMSVNYYIPGSLWSTPKKTTLRAGRSRR
jgi:hypothetical protein